MAKIPLVTSTPQKYLESCFCSVLDGRYCNSSADVVLVRTNNLYLHGEIVAKARAINSWTPLQLYVQFAIGQRWICARTSAFFMGMAGFAVCVTGMLLDAGMIETRKYSSAWRQLSDTFFFVLFLFFMMKGTFLSKLVWNRHDVS